MLTFLLFILFAIAGLIPVIRFAWDQISSRRAINAANEEAQNDDEFQEYKFNWHGLIMAFAWLMGMIILFFMTLFICRVWMHYQWFAELNAASSYATRMKTRALLLFGTAALCILWIYFNAKATAMAKSDNTEYDAKLRLPRYPLYGFGALLAWGVAVSFANNEQMFLEYWYGVPFNITDPIFGKDISFYVFQLPFWSYLVGTMYVVLIATLIVLGILYGLRFARIDNFPSTAKKKYFALAGNHAINHGAVLIALLMLTIIFDFWLGRYSILASEQGVVFGAGYTDVHITLPMYWVMIIALIVSIIFLGLAYVSSTLRSTIKWSIAGIALPIAVYAVGILIFPSLYQHYFVTPSELETEAPYIQYDLEYTKKAFKLDTVERKEFPAVTDALTNPAQTDTPTLENIRLWTPDTLRTVNSSRQLLRRYYSFADIDIDRYDIAGTQRQVMLSARELDSKQLPSQTWQNKHLVYTHGYGMTMAPVNSFGPEGVPEYLIKDVPTTSTVPTLQITQPRIYFGELSTEHIYVGTHAQEFDFPQGEDNAYFRYDGPAGIPIGSGLRKLLIALNFDGLRLLTSNEIHSESRLLYRRDIASRLQALTPFIHFDKDPYQVIADGQLVFICDGYTWSKSYPYSKPIKEVKDNPYSGWNYVRNSVKAVVNAYTGQVDLYVSDQTDPIMQTYQTIYPELFQPMTNMPQSLRAHMRYPEELFNMQAEQLANYHMQDPQIFYNKEDTWQISHEGSLKGSSNPMEAYYVNMQMPGKPTPEFILVVPFSPLSQDPAKPNRNNLVGWLAGQSDGENYGKLTLFRFPKEKNVDGPLQIWARINSDTTITSDFKLWSGQDSEVIPGNLIVVPLSNNELLYVQSLFLQSKVGKMPELKRVIVGTQGKLGYGNTFGDALTQLFKTGKPAPRAPDNANQTQSPNQNTTSTTQPLAEQAQALMDEYTRETASGNFDKAGLALNKLRQVIQNMNNK